MESEDHDDRATAVSRALRFMTNREVFEASTATGSTYHVMRHPDGGFEVSGGRSLRGWERAEIVGAVPDSSGYARLAVIRTDPGPDDKSLTTSPVMRWRIVPRAEAG
jgi:hypothetical protein